jgi:hypothetical protein
MNAKAQSIISQCDIVFDANKADCNKFVKAVASHFGIELQGAADSIVDGISGAEWTQLSDGIAAKAQADSGFLVIGGLKGSDMSPPEDHGHVVIVVSGPLAQDKYPTAYWGKLEGVGSQNKTVNWAWTSANRDKVKYACRSVEI